ncbi:MAG: family 78 glycoside hydrolase catalytic domain [Candidatus Cyclobacteriaceae bacterium M3_2C_046]
MKKSFVIILLLIFWGEKTSSQVRQLTKQVNPELLQSHWTGFWIAPPEVSLKDYGVYLFRKNFILDTKPTEFIINISADNRYNLFVNGKYLCNGPSRGDLFNWRFETIDIAPFLHQGENLIAAEVWNYGKYIPWAQISDRTGFLVQGNSADEHIVNTNSSWKVIQNQAFEPYLAGQADLNQFIVVGPGDQIDGSKYPWGWQNPDFDDENWQTPLALNNAAPPGVGTDLFWMMVPRTIPLMEENTLRMSSVRRSEGIKIPDGFLNGDSPLKVGPDQQISFLIDQTYLTTAYPEIILSGGKGAAVRLTYGEALFQENGDKGNRNVIEGKQLKGYRDLFIADGGEERRFRPLWFRTYRYIKVDVTTKSEPLTIHDLYGIFTAYPFEENGYFSADDRSLQDIWQTGWRTARLCAGETYFDCPYYEQLQYVGDTRIQALISLYVSGDDRLMKKAISLFDNSRLPNGLTQSRYPSSSPQVIPPYSLFWISMIYDYWMHRDDPEFVKSFLFGIQGVLYWYEQHLGENGLLGPMPWWNFVDWTEEWPWVTEKRIGGVPEGGSLNKGNSSIITLQYVYNLDYAAELFAFFGNDYLANHYRTLSEKTKEALVRACWDTEKGFFADTPKKTVFSQHANIMAVLVDLIPASDQNAFMTKVLNHPDLIQTTFYYKFYQVRAMKKAGLGDQYVESLDPWRNMLDLGLTTFAEKPDPTRSDCHAWSASPNYDLLSTVCGIEPDAPGFKSVSITPHLGRLKQVQGGIPHPMGEIKVELQQTDQGLTGTVELPQQLKGTFSWNQTAVALNGGRQHIEIKKNE